MGIVDRTRTPDFVSEFSKEELERSIPARFERMVAKYPDRIAVRTQSHAVTYAALRGRLFGLARGRLRRAGVECPRAEGSRGRADLGRLSVGQPLFDDPGARVVHAGRGDQALLRRRADLQPHGAALRP